jgi:hypothetical protein
MYVGSNPYNASLGQGSEFVSSMQLPRPVHELASHFGDNDMNE